MATQKEFRVRNGLITGAGSVNELRYPLTDGTASQVLTTDGAGNLTFADKTFTINELTDVDTTGAVNGSVLKYNGVNWVVGTDDTGAGGTITLTDLSVTQNAAAGNGTLTYNNTNGVFTYTPPDLSSYLTTETDPVFTASAAASITAGNITNWDTAFGWGDHSTQGYLTSVAFDDLTDVTITTPVLNDLIIYNGTSWVNVELANHPTQQELDQTQTGAGLSGTGAYVQPVLTNYIDGATSLANADELLDAAIGNLSNDYVSSGTFNTTDGNLTLTRTDGGNVVVNFDGRYLTSETTTSLSLATNILTYTDELGAQTNIDLSIYLDDTNLARLVSGTVDGVTGIATFTRDDASTFTVDFSALFDDTNLARITSGSFNTLNGELTLTRDDASTIVTSFDGRYLTSYTETDPFFTASPAATITNQDITEWNTAFGWGDHALAGYLTAEADTLDTVTTRGNITTNDIEVGNVTTSGVTFSTAPVGSGVMNWSTANETLNLTMGNGVVQQIGEEVYYPVVGNETGATIPNGTPVMAAGPSGLGDFTNVQPAIADGSIDHVLFLGVTTEDIPNGSTGRVTYFGKVNDIDTSAYPYGTLLYVSDVTPGAFVTTPPISPSITIPVALVTSQNATTGRIFVRHQYIPDAIEVPYSNTTSGLVATNVQNAIDELESVKADVSLIQTSLSLYATDTPDAIIPGYFRSVSTINDPDYDLTPVDIPTGAITTSAQPVGVQISDPGVLIGSPGLVNITTVGNIRKTTAKNDWAEFYYEVYKRDNLGTETLLSTSSTTGPVFANATVPTDYAQFFAQAVLVGTTWVATDRVVIKYYANALNGVASEYEFQFGGEAPVRTNFPVPVSVVAGELVGTNIIVDTTNFNGILSAADNTLQEALDTIDDYTYTETDPVFTASVAATITSGDITNWNDAFSWGNHALAGYLTSAVLNDLTDVVITTPTSGQVLKFNGTNWVNAADNTGTGGGGEVFQRAAVTTATYNVVPGDTFIGVNSPTGTTINLLNGQTAGTKLIIKDEGGFARTNNINVIPTGGETIDGTTSVSIGINYGSITLIYTGIEWSIV